MAAGRRGRTDPRRGAHRGWVRQRAARLFRRVTPLGRVLICLTVLVTVAVVVLHDVAVDILAVGVCLCWLRVYTRTDPMHREAAGDDPGRDAIGWRDREL